MTEPHQDVWDASRNGVRRLASQCATCIFKPGNLMHLNPGRLREITSSFRRGEGYMICHDTVTYGAHPGAGPAVCRGMYDKYSTQFTQIGDRLGWWVDVEPPGNSSGRPGGRPD